MATNNGSNPDYLGWSFGGQDAGSQSTRERIRQRVDLLSRQSGLGSLSEASSDALIGINHRGVGNPIPHNKDNQGLTFFTRPRLNLSYNNLAMDRRLTPLLTEVNLSYQRAIRVLLDPVGATGHAKANANGSVGARSQPVTSDLVNHNSPFIPLLSNNLISLNGWPDPVVSYYQSKEGIQKETWSMVDDVSRNYGAFDLQASFRNIAGDPITLLFEVWRIYMANVYSGVMLPYPDSIIENEIDYQTRIYRLILDPTRQYVQKIGVANACFPLSSALGAAFNFSADSPYNQETASQISIPFHCIGAEYGDPILIREFNDLVCFFNPNMFDDVRESVYKLLAKDELLLFNYFGYPRIDPLTNRLEWWVPMAEYTALKAAVQG